MNTSEVKPASQSTALFSPSLSTIPTWVKAVCCVCVIAVIIMIVAPGIPASIHHMFSVTSAGKVPANGEKGKEGDKTGGAEQSKSGFSPVSLRYAPNHQEGFIAQPMDALPQYGGRKFKTDQMIVKRPDGRRQNISATIGDEIADPQNDGDITSLYGERPQIIRTDEQL